MTEYVLFKVFICSLYIVGIAFCLVLTYSIILSALDIYLKHKQQKDNVNTIKKYRK